MNPLKAKQRQSMQELHPEVVHMSNLSLQEAHKMHELANTNLVNVTVQERYKCMSRLGNGGQSTVWLAHDNKHSEDVAIKFYGREDEKIRELGMIRTIKGLKGFSILKDKVVKWLGEDGSIPYQYAVYELCDYTLEMNIREIYVDNPDLLGAHIKTILSDTILPAMQFLHDNDIVHGDIKAGNIFGKQGKYGMSAWKLADFDRATYSGNTLTGTTYLPQR